MKFAIIGSGVAGLSCAEELTEAGHTVSLFDKGRGAGGRMSTRRMATPLGTAHFDHGAQYFTARDPDFARLVAAWHDRGIVAPWPIAATDAWVGVPGMNAVVEHMAATHSPTWRSVVTGLSRKSGQWWLAVAHRLEGPFDGVLLAIPAEQAAAVLSLHDFQMARVALMARSQPCWTAMLAFDRPLDHLPRVVRNTGPIVWAACNSAKPGRTGPESWVVQASPTWSLARLEASQEAITPLLQAAFAEAMAAPIPEPIAAVSHRWRYALVAGTGDGALWNPALGLGTCGDWLLGPRVECAWLSGRMLAQLCVGWVPSTTGEAVDGIQPAEQLA